MIQTKSKYGLDFPAEMPDFQVELLCAKHWREKLYRSGNLDHPGDHMRRAISMLFTRAEFTPNRWSDLMVDLWCKEEFVTIIGAASTGKSNTIGLLALLDYLTDSRETLTFLVSTTRQMLEIRSYESVMRYWNILRTKGDWGVTLNRQRMALLNKSDDASEASSEVKAAIRGVAIKQGTVEEAKSNLQGGHLPYVRLIIDEMQQTRPAAFEARHNLSVGTRDFKFIGLANPDSIYDLSGRASKPKDPRGWGAVTVDDEMWESVFGKTLHLDGKKSPAVVEPDGAEKYPFLIKPSDINRIIQQNHGNEDAPSVWTMVRGFPPPQGLTQTVLTEIAVRKFRMQEQVQWRDKYVTYGSLDPSFTSGGDGCVFQPFRVGVSVAGITTVLFLPPHYIEIQASSELPVQYQIAKRVEEIARELGVPSDRIVVDETGTQRVADVIEMQWGPVGWRYVGSSRPSELPVSSVNSTPADKRYRNKVTEAWYTVSEFAQFDQLRGVCDDACRQFTMRTVKPGTPIAVEPKEDFKARLTFSPDEADAVAMACQFLRERAGVVPGGARSSSEFSGSLVSGADSLFTLEQLRDVDLDGRENSYLVQDL